MMFDFFIIGAILIWCVFYARLDAVKNWILVASISLLFIGYFNLDKSILIANVSVNLFGLISFILLVVYFLTYYKNIRFSRMIENVSYVVLLYLGLNIVSIEFNLFFNCLPLIAIIVVINGFNGFNFFTSILGLNISLFFVEILNSILMINQLQFATIFSREFVICYVYCNVLMTLLYIVVKFLKRGAYEKIC